MLKKMQSSLAFHRQATQQSLHLLTQKPLTSAMTILVIAIALALPAFFWVFTDNLSHFTNGWQRGGHISLYLKPIPSIAQKNVLERVQATEMVGQATLKSPQEGLAELTQQEGMHDIMRYLPQNPLPAVIDIVPAVTVDTPSQFSALVKELQRFSEVEQVKWDMEWINRLHTIIEVASKLAHALMSVLALAVILIIGTTLRLALHNHQEEIKILKLIGANDAYILRPYLYLGLWYGLAGAVLAVVLVAVFACISSSVINQLTVVYQLHYPSTGLSIRQILLLMAFAIILGKLAARLSIRRQLLSIEPYK